MVLVPVAVTFGAVGVCGIADSSADVWRGLTGQGTAWFRLSILLSLFGVVALVIASLLLWTVVLLFKRESDRDG